MTEGIYTQDIHLLEQLIDTIRHSGQSMAEIDGHVGNYIRAVNDALERQLDFLRDKLNEAQNRLQAAEQALSSCEASQVFVPELGGYVPSCTCEEEEVSAARNEVNDWQRKYEAGQRIVAESQRETDDYNGVSGGHNLICNMANSQMPKAVEYLSDIIGKAKAIIEAPIVSEVPEGSSMVTGNMVAASQTSANDKRFDAFRENMRREIN